MEFPFGHRHHPSRRDEEEEEEEERRRREQPHYPPPGRHHGSEQYGGRGEEECRRPPPRYGGGEGGYYGEDAYQRQPLAPGPHHAGYETGEGYPGLQHVSHEVRPGEPYGKDERGGGRYDGRHQGHHGGSFPSNPYEDHGASGAGGSLAGKGTVRIFTKATENYALSVRDGKVILARSNPTDEYQHWIKDEKFSTKVKDEEGLPSFALVNKVTGEAIKHSVGATHPVRLVPYSPDYLDESVLWTESYDTGEDFRCIRMVNNIRLNFDAFHGDKDHGGVRDGTIVVLWEWMKGENQRWKIVPY